MSLSYEEVLKFKRKALFKQAEKDYPDLFKNPQFSVSDIFLATSKYALISEVKLDGVNKKNVVVMPKSRYQYVLPWEEIEEVYLDTKRKTLNFKGFTGDIVRIYYDEPYEARFFGEGKKMGYKNAKFVAEKSTNYLQSMKQQEKQIQNNRSELFEKILKKTRKISLKNITKLLGYSSMDDFLLWLYELPDEYAVTVDGDVILFNWKDNEVEELIQSLVKNFEKWENKGDKKN